MRIALLEPLGISPALLDELSQPIIAQGHEFIAYPDKAKDTEELIRRSRGCELIMIANRPYPAEAVEAADALKFINVAFTGIDHVGLQACAQRSIRVCNAANYSNGTVAELVIGMVISLYRKLAAAEAAVRGGGTSAGLAGREIAGKTVGIVGTGRIGMMTAKLFRAFGAEVIAFSRTEKEEAKALGIRYVPLPELMKESDIVSIHVPNNASTRGMISAEMIGLMRERAVLINCARGPIVDNAALAQALRAHRIAGAGIDVFEMEPPLPADYPLLDAPNCLLTPHVAFLSEEAMIRRARIAFRNTMAYLAGKPENLCDLG